LAGSGRGAEQGHGNARWIPPDLEAKAQHHENGVSFHLNKKEATRELKVNFNNETLPFCSEPKYLRVMLDRSLTYVLPTPRATLQEANITRRTPESAWWLRLGHWSNNVANSHPSPGPFNCRVPRSCLVLQCSYPPHWPCHQRRLANCDWIPSSHTSRQPSNPRRHQTCRASSQWSHTSSRTPCHGAWTSAPLSAHPSIKCKHGTPNWETHLYPPHSNSSVFWQQHICGAVGGSSMECGVGRQPHKTPHFNSRHRYSHTLRMTLPGRAIGPA